MTNKTITSIILRVTGLVLLIKFLDFFGAFYLAIYKGFNYALSEHYQSIDISDFERFFSTLFWTSVVLTILNFFLAVLMIFKADWITNKLIKTEINFTVAISANEVFRIIIVVLGINFSVETILNLPMEVEFLKTLIEHSDSLMRKLLPNRISFILKAIIGILFIVKSKSISNFILKSKNSKYV